MKYRRKSTVIEPVLWEGPQTKHVGVHRDLDGYYVITVHGQRTALEPGVWIMPEPDGIHYYPCDPKVFAELYEPVE